MKKYLLVIFYIFIPIFLIGQNTSFFPSQNVKFFFTKVSISINDSLNKEIRDSVALTYNKLSDSLMQVNYEGRYGGLINPYNIDFIYYIKKYNTYDAVNMTFMLDAFDMYWDKTNVIYHYEGDDIIYPNKLHVGDTLPSAIGTFYFDISKGAISLLYQIELKNRKITNVSSIELRGQHHLAYLIQSNYEIKKVNGKKHNIIISTQEHITEWLVPNFGVVQQRRNNGQKMLEIKFE